MIEQAPMFPDLIVADPAADLPRVPCRGCGHLMCWVKSTKGGMVPLDPDPVPNGNLVLVRDESGNLIAEYLRRSDRPAAGTLRYVSHFATCPNADRFRR